MGAGPSEQPSAQLFIGQAGTEPDNDDWKHLGSTGLGFEFQLIPQILSRDRSGNPTGKIEVTMPWADPKHDVLADSRKPNR
jgi:hypothetical protein